MKVLLIGRIDEFLAAGLVKILEKAGLAGRMKFCPSIKDFKEQLSQSGSNGLITVVLAARQEFFHEILKEKELFFRTRLVLILPDRRKETIALGHSMRPRIVWFADQDFTGLGATVRKMVQHQLPEKIIKNQEGGKNAGKA